MIGENRVRTVLSEGDVVVTIEATVGQASDGELDVQCRINGYEVDILSSAKGTEDALAGFRLDLEESEMRLVSQWSRLSESVTTLGEIARATSPTNTWGCGACVLLGVGVELTTLGCVSHTMAAVASAGTTAGTALAACGAAAGSWALVEENCVGACHHLIR